MATQTTHERSDTAQRVLDVAEELVQVRGFNAFSYADIAAELGITKASLHYHFQSKAELGRALIDRYSKRFMRALERIDRDESTGPAKLAAYASLYTEVLRGQRMCLCGMLAADYETLPHAIGDAVVAFFDDNEAWLERVLEDGRAQGHLDFEGSARERARVLVSTLEGAMLVARSYRDPDRFQGTADALLASLNTSRRSRR